MARPLTKEGTGRCSIVCVKIGKINRIGNIIDPKGERSLARLGFTPHATGQRPYSLPKFAPIFN